MYAVIAIGTLRIRQRELHELDSHISDFLGPHKGLEHATSLGKVYRTGFKFYFSLLSWFPTFYFPFPYYMVDQMSNRVVGRVPTGLSRSFMLDPGRWPDKDFLPLASVVFLLQKACKIWLSK